MRDDATEFENTEATRTMFVARRGGVSRGAYQEPGERRRLLRVSPVADLIRGSVAEVVTASRGGDAGRGAEPRGRFQGILGKMSGVVRRGGGGERAGSGMGEGSGRRKSVAHQGLVDRASYVGCEPRGEEWFLDRVLPAGGHPSHRTAALWRLEGLQARVATRNAFSTDLKTFVFINLSICKLQS